MYNQLVGLDLTVGRQPPNETIQHHAMVYLGLDLALLLQESAVRFSSQLTADVTIRTHTHKRSQLTLLERVGKHENMTDGTLRRKPNRQTARPIGSWIVNEPSVRRSTYEVVARPVRTQCVRARDTRTEPRRNNAQRTTHAFDMRRNLLISLVSNIGKL